MSSKVPPTRQSFLSAMDVVKLGMVAFCFYTLQNHYDYCPLYQWLMTLWQVFLADIILKILTHTLLKLKTVAGWLMFCLQVGEFGWHCYGLWLMVLHGGDCKDEIQVGVYLALGIFSLSSLAAILLTLFQCCEKPKAIKSSDYNYKSS